MRLEVAVLAFLLSGCAIGSTTVPKADNAAGAAQAGSVRVSDAYISAPPGGAYAAGGTAGMHLLLTDSAKDADALTSGSSSAAAQVRFRTFDQYQERIAVPGGADGVQVTAELSDLSETLRSGDRVSLTLQFSNAGPVDISVPVQ